MAKWEINLGVAGSKLRAYINDEAETIDSCIRIVKQMKVCLDSIRRQLGEDHLTMDFMDLEDNVNDSIEDLVETSKEPVNHNNIQYIYGQHVVNDLLEQFYDYCDHERIWVGI